MYILKDFTGAIIDTSDQPINYYESELAWLVIGVCWYADPIKSYTVEETIPPAADGSPNVIG